MKLRQLRNRTFEQIKNQLVSLEEFLSKFDMNEDDGEIEKRIRELDKQLTEKKPQLIQPRANNLIF